MSHVFVLHIAMSATSGMLSCQPVPNEFFTKPAVAKQSQIRYRYAMRASIEYICEGRLTIQLMSVNDHCEKSAFFIN